MAADRRGTGVSSPPAHGAERRARGTRPARPARLARLASLALAGLVAGTFGCRRDDAGSEPAGEAGRRLVHCAVVATRTVEDVVELRGTVSPPPDRDAQVAPQVAGRIVQVFVGEGDAVTAGQPVARIDSSVLIDQANEARAARDRARAERLNAEATRARTERVFEHGIVARQEVDDATTRAASARAAEDEVEAAWHRARRQVERATLRSPIAGVVIHLLRRTGELVDGTPATPVVEVADPSRLELVANATASQLVRVRKGAPCDLVVTALDGMTWTGTVAAVSPAVDRTTGLGTVRVAFDLGAPAAAKGGAATRPPIGTLGTARVRVGAQRAAQVVPKTALKDAVGVETDVVLCGDDGHAHVRRVQRGVEVGADVEVTPLRAGQRVVLEPLGVADGDPIEIAK